MYCSRSGGEADEYGGECLRIVILRGIGEFGIDENGINMLKRRSWTASWTVFFFFFFLWMHCLPLFRQYGCNLAPAGKGGGSFFVAVVLGGVIYLY